MKNSTKPKIAYQLDETICDDDIAQVRRLTTLCGNFKPEEIDVACELVIDRLTGKDPDYLFVMLRNDQQQVVGYTCYGMIPMTDKRYDLYWIIVDPEYHGQGIGTYLLEETLTRIRKLDGKIVYIETSATSPFTAAQQFYTKHGFDLIARIPDFYRDGDDKVTYAKSLVTGH